MRGPSAGRAVNALNRDNEKLKKTNEHRRKDRLRALTLKLMRGDAPGSSVPLATHSATTEARGYRHETDPSIFTLGRFI